MNQTWQESGCSSSPEIGLLGVADYKFVVEVELQGQKGGLQGRVGF